MSDATRSKASYSAQQLRAYAHAMRQSPNATAEVLRLCDHIDTTCDELRRTEHLFRAGVRLRVAIGDVVNAIGDEDDGGGNG